jgi:lipoate-protein ligase B
MILNLGLTDYEKAYLAQCQLVSRRRLGEIGDSMIITEHNPVFTIGRTGRRENMLADSRQMRKRGVRLIEVDRGGDITFHGPGQLLLYPVVDLKARGRDLHRYMRDLESVAINFLNSYGIIAERIDGKTGVWVGGSKVASIGVGAKDWVTFHGLSVNVDIDLSYFSMIYPCGMRGIKMTSLAEILGVDIDLNMAAEKLIVCAKRVLGVGDGIFAGTPLGAAA